MKIAVTATEPSLDAPVDPRFGRCPCFLIVETDDLTFEAVENPNVMLGGGAGIQSGQLMSEKGVRFVLTGNCGPNAYQTLSAAGIEVIAGCSGVVREVVAQFRAGQFGVAAGPTVEAHAGMGAAPPSGQPQADQPPPGMNAPELPPMPAAGPGVGGGGGRGGLGGGRGRGGGRGMGRGMGRGGGGGGMGRGMGGGMGLGGGAGAASALPPQVPQPPNKADELRMLKQQAEQMGSQMQQIQERIRRLEEEP